MPARLAAGELSVTLAVMRSAPQSSDLSAFAALEIAQWISFAPFVFQASAVLRDRGLLEALEGEPDGLTLAEIAERVKLPVYGVRVLIEAGLGIGLVREDEAGRYHGTKIAYFLLHDDMTRRNMDFTRDVNYRALSALDQAITEGRPAGLAEFGNWPTIYEGLAELPEPVRQSWFAFDHFYSDAAFAAALPLVFADGRRRLLDVGGNTGRWAKACCEHDESLEITILDLPGQLANAKEFLREAGHADRVNFHTADVLSETAELPTGFDVVWMSQFLDCFSEAEIVSILSRFAKTLGPEGRLFILETLWDRQDHDVAQFCLQMTSLYFTAVANGNSQMYRSSLFLACIKKAGLEVVSEHDQIGRGHTLIECRRAQ